MQLRDLPLLELPTDHARPTIASQKGAAFAVNVSADLKGKLEELGRRAGVTLFMLLLTGLNILLSRYTDEEDILIGTGVANRGHAYMEDLVGMFVNTLILRTDWRGSHHF